MRSENFILHLYTQKDVYISTVVDKYYTNYVRILITNKIKNSSIHVCTIKSLEESIMAFFQYY